MRTRSQPRQQREHAWILTARGALWYVPRLLSEICRLSNDMGDIATTIDSDYGIAWKPGFSAGLATVQHLSKTPVKGRSRWAERLILDGDYSRSPDSYSLGTRVCGIVWL